MLGRRIIQSERREDEAVSRWPPLSLGVGLGGRRRPHWSSGARGCSWSDAGRGEWSVDAPQDERSFGHRDPGWPPWNKCESVGALSGLELPAASLRGRL